MTSTSSVTIPDFVDYPDFLSVSDNGHIFKKLFAYVIEPYPLDGVSLFIGIRGENILVRLSDFKSNTYDLEKLDDRSKQILDLSTRIIEMQALIQIVDACYYFAFDKDDPILVDVMISANKFMGPGMLRDVYSSSFRIQETIEVCTLDEDNLNKYKGKFVKPSRFRHLMDGDCPRPQYGIID